MKITLEVARASHAEALAPRMRLEDRTEVLASHGHSPSQALQYALDRSVEAWSMFVDGEVVAIFGVAPVSTLNGIFTPWMLGSADIPRYAKSLLPLSRMVVKDWAERYPTLVNYTDSRYHAAVRWLKWLGFTMEPAAPVGPQGVPFHRFTMGS